MKLFVFVIHLNLRGAPIPPPHPTLSERLSCVHAGHLDRFCARRTDRVFEDEDETRPKGPNRSASSHVELRGDAPTAQRPADGRERLLQLADPTLPRGLSADLRGKRVSLTVVWL